MYNIKIKTKEQTHFKKKNIYDKNIEHKSYTTYVSLYFSAYWSYIEIDKTYYFRVGIDQGTYARRFCNGSG